MQTFDLILRHGTVIDGSGAQGHVADIGVRGTRIAAIGDLSNASATRDIDISGRCVTPGFLDVHTHDDRALMSAPALLPKLSQGVTTVVTGNCGISLAPLVADHAEPPLNLVATPEWLRYPAFGDYLDDLRRHDLAVNVMALVGHTTLRANVLDDLSQPATAEQCERMRALFDDAMQAGAWGLSTGTFYPPARAATTEEVIAVGEPLTRHGGIFATHMRNEAERVIESLDETFQIGRALDVRVVISHHKLAGLCNHGRSVETLAHIAQAMQSQPIGLDCYPYNASSTMLHPDLIERASSVLVAWSKTLPEYAGQLLSDVAQAMQCDEKTAAVRLAPAGAIYFLMDEADVRRILAFDFTMIGSDGMEHDEHPHPRLWGTFPRVLGHYARELGLFTMEKAVHKMTGLPASQFKLADRGLLREGYYADLVVIDAASVIDRATFAEPKTPAAGIEQVYVNGELAYGEGAQRAFAGQVLPGPGWRG